MIFMCPTVRLVDLNFALGEEKKEPSKQKIVFVSNNPVEFQRTDRQKY